MEICLNPKNLKWEQLLIPKKFRERLKCAIAWLDVPAPSPPPHIDFGPISYWSRGFVSNNRGFSLVKSLHWTLDLAIATALPRLMTQMLQLPAWDWGLYTFNLLCKNKIWSKNATKKNCSNLPEMAIKLIENVFCFWQKFWGHNLALWGITVEKGLHWVPMESHSAPARGRSVSEGIPYCLSRTW